jgi:hypothetical protein
LVEGEQYPPGPQSASTRQLPGMHLFPLLFVEGTSWQAQRSPVGQSVSCMHESYVHAQVPTIWTQRPFVPAVHWLSFEHGFSALGGQLPFRGRVEQGSSFGR